MYGCTGSAFVRHCTLPFLSKRCKKCSGRENVVYHVVDGQKRESRMKKETLQELFSDKRRLAVVCVLICCVIVAVIGGVFLLALQEQNRESASIQEKEQLRYPYRRKSSFAHRSAACGSGRSKKEPDRWIPGGGHLG